MSAEINTGNTLKKKLKSVQTENAGMKAELLSLVTQFDCLDKMVHAIGVVNNSFSFTQRVSWDGVIDSLNPGQSNQTEQEETKLAYIKEALGAAMDEVKTAIIPAVRRMRNKWMLQALLFDAVFIMVISALIAGTLYTQGILTKSGFVTPVSDYIYDRPLFLLIITSIVLVSFLTFHFQLRNRLATKLSAQASNENAEFDIGAAFLKNTRLRHSIFRPDIVGISRSGRKCLNNHYQTIPFEE